MKIVLPENISEINLGQFQRYHRLVQRTDLNTLDFNKRKIEIFTGIPFQKLSHIKQADYDSIIAQIDKGLNTNCPFVDRFTLNNIEFGFIPNFDKIIVAEQADLEEYADKEDELHRTMAILFRPVTNTDAFKNYVIEDYNGTEKYCELMKLMPMNIVNGALGFFLNLSKELEIAIQRYTAEVQAREVTH